MTDIQVLVDKSPLPPGFSPVCDPLDSSEARVRGWGGMGGRVRVPVGRTREGWRDDRTGACFPSHDRALGDDRAGCGVEPCSEAGPHALPCVKMCGWHSL